MTPTQPQSYRPPKKSYARAAVQPPGERFCPTCNAQLWLRQGENDYQYAKRTFCNLACSRKKKNTFVRKFTI